MDRSRYIALPPKTRVFFNIFELDRTPMLVFWGVPMKGQPPGTFPGPLGPLQKL